jgi:hypothetical protein
LWKQKWELQTKQQHIHFLFEKKKIVTNETEDPAGLSIFHLAFRGRDADEVTLENQNTVPAS